MIRLSRAAAAGALLALLVPAPSTAAPAPAASPDAPGAVLAFADHVFLNGDPWRPSAPLTVTVFNEGQTATPGFFVLRLPPGVALTDRGNCRPAAGASATWTCGGAEVAPGGRREYRLTVTSSTAEPVFGVDAWGSVTGRDGTGVTTRTVDVRINWPDRTSLRLGATAAPVVDGQTTVAVRVTNAGTFAIGGYALNVTTPDGVRVIGPSCSDSGRMDGVGCEILRSGPVPAGAADRFAVRLAVTGGTRTVRLNLAPTERYTNRDTSVALRLAGGEGSGAGDVTPSPTGTARPTGAPTATASGQGAPELARTGAAGTAYALAGVALLAFGAALLLVRRRLARD
ncbi:LPXTG cell wall anchor domain-containing protein [Micromonospora sp. URMC 103]|uniref:LPXTG cell wall anchor domain-containing protein n=1 Tax=Micromonospora sp. URMC 103 TaxID=3423406 RepID=UPI003F19A667